MPRMLRVILCLLILSPAPAAAAAKIDIEPFLRDDDFDEVTLSPDGAHLAATVPLQDRTGLAILRRSDLAVTARFALARNQHIVGLTWVNEERVLFSVAERFGTLDQPLRTGELLAINIDGSKAENLVGFRVESRGPGTRIQPKEVERVAAFLIDTLPGERKHVLVSVWPEGDEPFTRAERMDVYTGRRKRVAMAPVRRADFVADHAGEVRFALGAAADNVNKLYHRSARNDDWTLVNDESKSGVVELAIGFDADDRIAYLLTEQRDGPAAIVALDTETMTRRVVLRDARVDPEEFIGERGKGWGQIGVPLGVVLFDGRPKTAFFAQGHRLVRLQRSLEAAFPGEQVRLASITRDGKLALVETRSDRNPGDYFLFDIEAGKADHLLSRRRSIDPERMASMTPISLKARDGLELHGYLTLPPGDATRGLPMVVAVHGGPFGQRDLWAFDTETQLLAAAGYAVLQVNFRGSGGYGRAFEEAGARQWGQAMQDDVTDATRWAIEQGHADPARICIHGASYGAYAALVGAAREPSLYRCASGNIGVYDLPMMHSKGDIQRRGSGETYLREWLGERSALAAHSPVNMAAQIQVPVLLAAGEEDERAPPEHTRRMERKLRDAGRQVEAHYFDREGHGYYAVDSRRRYYGLLLDFLGRHLAAAPGE